MIPAALTTRYARTVTRWVCSYIHGNTCDALLRESTSVVVAARDSQTLDLDPDAPINRDLARMDTQLPHLPSGPKPSFTQTLMVLRGARSTTKSAGYSWKTSDVAASSSAGKKEFRLSQFDVGMPVWHAKSSYTAHLSW